MIVFKVMKKYISFWLLCIWHPFTYNNQLFDREWFYCTQQSYILCAWHIHCKRLIRTCCGIFRIYHLDAVIELVSMSRRDFVSHLWRCGMRFIVRVVVNIHCNQFVLVS